MEIEFGQCPEQNVSSVLLAAWRNHSDFSRCFSCFRQVVNREWQLYALNNPGHVDVFDSAFRWTCAAVVCVFLLSLTWLVGSRLCASTRLRIKTLSIPEIAIEKDKPECKTPERKESIVFALESDDKSLSREHTTTTCNCPMCVVLRRNSELHARVFSVVVP